MIATHTLREVLRLLLLPKGLSHTYIGKLAHCPRQTVDDLHKKLLASSIDAKSFFSMDDDELQRQIYPRLLTKKRLKVEPDYEAIIIECIKSHKKFKKTIWIKFCEYKQMYGHKGYCRSRFYQLFAQYIKNTRLSMLQIFAPGEVMFIDYAGSTLSYQDEGQEILVYAFVATLGYSKKRFAFATKDMTAKSWIDGIIAAINFCGGVPEVIHFDNAKSMVKKSGIVAELSRSAKEFSDHYDVLIDTSKVATPTHNPLAENRVKELTHSVFATMNRDLTFFSLNEINDYLKLEVEKLNEKPIQKIGISANDLFYSDESNQLNSIPRKRFEPITYRSVVKVPENYYIWYKNNRYSIPYEYRNDYVELRVKGHELQVFHKGILRVVHDVVDGKNNVVSIETHLHPSHQAQKNKTKSHYLRWAQTLGVDIERIVEHFYSKTKHEHSRPIGKRCQVFQKLQNKYGDTSFILACQHALTCGMVSVTEIDLILKSKIYEKTIEPEMTNLANVRGQNYYSGGYHE